MQIVFILENGVTEKAETNGFIFKNQDKALVTWPSGQRAYIYLKDKDIKWKEVK
jgi:hypothetical protein